MRDPKRIDRILSMIKVLWVTQPQLRLHQLLGNLYPDNPDLFYIEDEELEKRLKLQIKGKVS